MPTKITNGSKRNTAGLSGKMIAQKGSTAAAKAAPSSSASSASSSSSSSASSSSSSDASSDDEEVPEDEVPSSASKSDKSKGKQKEITIDDEDESDSDASKEEEDSEDEGPRIDLDKIRKRMHHALRHLASASKRARQFEVQRLVKRIKSAPTAEKSSLEAQLLIFKSIDLQRIAATCLLGKLGKAKLLPRGATSKDFKTAGAHSEQKGVDTFPLLAGVWSEEGLRQVWMDVSSPADLASDAEKVKAKLLSSKSLAEESSQMVETLGRLAGRVRPKAAAETPASEDKKGEQKAQKATTATEAPKEDDERTWSGSEGEVDEDDEEQLGSSSEAESDQEDLDEEAIQARVAALGDLDKWDALVGAGSSDEEDEESDSNADVASQEEQAPISKRKRSLSPRDSKPVKKTAKKSDAKSRSKLPVASSDEDSETEAEVPSSDGDGSDSDASDYSSEGSSASSSSSRNLPSLSHGFLAHSRRRRVDDDFSGSEGSDDDDYEGEIEENPEDKASKAKGVQSAKERKNRMGQRARKALWEKKFGRNANHIKILEKESSKKRSTEKGSDSNGKPAYKPLRRGRDGKVIPDFEAPKQTDAGWKKFPVATTASEPAAAPTPTVGRVSAAPPAGKGGKPPARGSDRHPPPSSTAPRGGYSGGAPPVRFQTQEKQQQEQEMHPSWLAKQKQKEREDLIARSLAGGAGAGKKVTFD